MNSSNFFDLIILFGTIQGFITSILLFRSKKNRQSNRLLAIIILLFSLAGLNMYLFLTLNTAGPIILQIAEQIVPLIMAFTNVKPQEHKGRGVLPHYEVGFTRDDLIIRNDRQLNFLKELIRKDIKSAIE